MLLRLLVQVPVHRNIICLWALTWTACILLGTGPIWGQDLETLQRQLWQKQEAKEKTEREVASLTREERAANTKLASLEEKIRELGEKKQTLQTEFADLQDTQKELQLRIEELGKREAMIRAEINVLLPHLWEIALRAEALKTKVFESWPESDRSMVWLARLVDTAHSRIQDLQEVQTAAGKRERELQTAQARLEEKRNELSRLDKELTGRRLTFLEQVQAVRKQRKAAQEELRALQARIQELQSKLSSKETKAFGLYKGRLPWPVQGRVIVEYEPEKGKSNRGLGFSLPAEGQVKAVARGEVVYNDKLRGFGQVIIIYHGHEYYSLYAFLSQSQVQTGHRVEQGEIIGQAGFYPKAQGPGMYFELRQRQATVDPRSWLAKR